MSQRRRFRLVRFLARGLVGVLVLGLLIAWLRDHIVELSGGERLTRPHVALAELLERRGTSDTQSESEMRIAHGRLVARVKAEYDQYVSGARKEPPVINILVLSSGGDYGAFGVGLLKGWRQVPPQHPMAKPEFDAVTGVSHDRRLRSAGERERLGAPCPPERQ